MTNMVISFASVASLLNEITEKPVKTVILSLFYNTKKFTDSIQNPTKNHLIYFRRVGIYIFQQKSVIWRHNGYFHDFLCGTLTSSFFEECSSFWHIIFFSVWHCMGLQTSFSVNVFNSIWPTKMAKMTVKIKICVKQITKHRFVLILSRW